MSIKILTSTIGQGRVEVFTVTSLCAELAG